MNESAVDLEDRQVPPRRLHVTFRAYSAGAALPYTIPHQSALQDLVIHAEIGRYAALARRNGRESRK